MEPNNFNSKIFSREKTIAGIGRTCLGQLKTDCQTYLPCPLNLHATAMTFSRRSRGATFEPVSEMARSGPPRMFTRVKLNS